MSPPPPVVLEREGRPEVGPASGGDSSPVPSITQRPEMCACLRPVLLISRSVAQRSCCGPAAQAAAEPLRDSRSCHFLCVAPGPLLEAKCACRVGEGARWPLSSIAPQGRGPAVCLSCGRRAPRTRGQPSSAQGLTKPAAGGAGKMFAASPGHKSKRPLWGRHVVPIRHSSWSPKRTHLSEK